MKNKLVPRARKFVAVLLGLLFMAVTVTICLASYNLGYCITGRMKINCASYSEGILSVTIDSNMDFGDVLFLVEAYDGCEKIKDAQTYTAEILNGCNNLCFTDCQDGESFKVSAINEDTGKVRAQTTVKVASMEEHIIHIE